MVGMSKSQLLKHINKSIAKLKEDTESRIKPAANLSPDSEGLISVLLDKEVISKSDLKNIGKIGEFAKKLVEMVSNLEEISGKSPSQECRQNLDSIFGVCRSFVSEVDDGGSMGCFLTSVMTEESLVSRIIGDIQRLE